MANGITKTNGLNGLIEPPNGLKPLYSVKNEKQVRRVSDSEYIREVTIGNAPDTFPCGHVMCHKCIRKHMTPSKEQKLSCPLCKKPAPRMYTADPGTSFGYNVDDVDNITLLSNFDTMVKRFDNYKYSLRRLHKESVQSRSMAMTYTNCACHLCNENHGTLQVLQEFNQLQISHERPKLPPTQFYRLSQGEVVTSFYSLVNSCCICVPCTYSELRESEHFPKLKLLDDNVAVHNPKAVLTEVGKIIAQNTAPLESLHGKNVIEVDHKIQLRQSANEYVFQQATDRIKKMVNDTEQNLIKLASCQVQDKGGLYHIKESTSVEQNMNETVVW